MQRTLDVLEQKRLALQAELDRQKTQAERNQLGQFATPTGLAGEILKYSLQFLPPGESVRFLDPAIGTGAFYSALRKVYPQNCVARALGFEIDPHYGKPAAQLWKGEGLVIRLTDFTHATPSGNFNLVICNPPYVRHHHLSTSDKNRLQISTQQASGIKISGLAGLYCHFIGLSHAWMMEGGVACWLVPSEFMDVNYGAALKKYLFNSVTLLHIHRFDPTDIQFTDALVSSAVVWFRKSPPPKDHGVKFTFGGTLLAPKLSRTVSTRTLAAERKWTRFPLTTIRYPTDAPTISDFFRVKRGLATGHNEYFILSEEEIKTRSLPMQAFRAILPSPRYLTEDEVLADRDGNPKVKPRCFLLDTKLPEEEIESRFPDLHAYLQEGKQQRLHERYLCRHRPIWYGQENRPPAPIVCTYLGRGDAKRGRPFRFILNHSRATVANVYLAMYPTEALADGLLRDPGLLRRLWQVLNAITPERLLGEGRVYGGGLYKLEPRELGNVPVPEIADILPLSERAAKQTDLFADFTPE